ncbi:MAG: ABC transporter ATP-binding protein [Chloroflexota bacterium]
MADALLEVDDIVTQYGPVVALHGVSFRVPEGQIVTLLGANGAGKTTTLRTISGLLRVTRGQILFDGKALHKMSPEQIVRAGVVQSPEGRQIFADLTVDENLEMGAYTRRDRAGIERDKRRVCEYFPVLGQRRSQPAGTLSGGEQQMLAIGRALMAKPRLLLLDEPSLGLAPLIVREIFEIVQTINREEGITVLLVEQDVVLALHVAHYGYVLTTGTVALHGPSERLRADESVRRSYLGY